MPAEPSPAQSEASRLNGARSTGPATAEGKARSALNGVRHGLCGRTFFLLPDEDPAEFREHESMWLAMWSPRDLHEHEAAASAIRAMWREIRADRLEAQVLGDLFAAGEIADVAEREVAKAAAFKALGSLLRYRARIEREYRQAMDALDYLRQRRLVRPPARPSESEPTPSAAARAPTAASHAPAAALPSEPEPAVLPVASAGAVAATVMPSEPEHSLNRHQRRALAAMSRRRAA
jgi:hypothetical protein